MSRSRPTSELMRRFFQYHVLTFAGAWSTLPVWRSLMRLRPSLPAASLPKALKGYRFHIKDKDRERMLDEGRS